MPPPNRLVPILHTMVIIGQIEGHLVLPTKNKTTKYEHIIPQLVAIEQNPRIKGLLVILNTVGGDVEAGLAIARNAGKHLQTYGLLGSGRGSFDRGASRSSG